MIFSKAMSVDVERSHVNDIIRLHEGDVDGSELRVRVYQNGSPFDLSGYQIKYDASIANYLAEEDANATASDNEITVPITTNMTSMNGPLKIDVKLIKNNDVAFLRTIEGYVQRRVINDQLIIDVSGTTIAQRLLDLAQNKANVTDLNNYVPKTRKVAGIDLQDDITASELKNALNIHGGGGGGGSRDLADSVGTMSEASYLPVGQDFFYYTDKNRLYIKDGANSTFGLARTDDVSGKEDASNKVTSLSSSSTDTQYPSAKCVYDLIGDIESALAALL